MHNARHLHLNRFTSIVVAAAVLGTWPALSRAQEDALVLSETPEAAPAPPAASSSLLAQARNAPVTADASAEPHALRAVSMFAIAPAESRVYREHDLIQIIVRESTTAKSKQELETEKDVSWQGAVSQWPDLQLSNLLNGWLRAGDTDMLPQVDLQFSKEFAGEGEYERRDDFTARLTAEVMQILPNGNLILESRTRMKQDDEEFVLKVTGISRPDDITPANTILSNQLHDLRVEKINSGELREANKKGLFTKAIDFLFAF